MIVDVNRDVNYLVQAFFRSDGCVAVVDNGILLGIAGQREFNIISGILHNDDSFFCCGVDRLLREGKVNTDFLKIELTENIDKDVCSFFSATGYKYVPIVSKGMFVRFAINGLVFDSDAITSRYRKRLIAERWNAVDRFSYVYDDYSFHCSICNNTINTGNAEKIVSGCLFGGGKLTRYICPSCGAVVGPLKMLSLTADELHEDITQHYAVYQEGDTTKQEISAFHMLEPEKRMRYLNYGCGGLWSNSIKTLRDEGYDVWGYEPFSAGHTAHSPYIITTRDDLAHQKFDGIFSNNLIEHLTEPVKELSFMKSLLNDTGSRMAHSTPCYEYRYPYTRFHICFPVKSSAQVMFANAGLNECNRYEGYINGDRFICICVKPE